MTVRIRETIHHGQYYNVQEAEGATIAIALGRVLEASPYNMNTFTHNFERCLVELDTTGRGEIGWARYEIIKED